MTYAWQYDNASQVFMSDAERVHAFTPELSTGAFYFMGEKWGAADNWRCLRNALAPNASAPGLPADCERHPLWRLASIVSYGDTPGMGPIILTGEMQIAKMWTMLRTDADPLGPDGRHFVSEFRAAIERLGDDAPITVRLTGTGVNSWAAVDRADAAWPAAAGALAAAAFVAALLATGSPLVAARCVATTFLTVCFAFGFAVLAYCHGVLDWTTAQSLSAHTTRGVGGSAAPGALHFAVPLVCAPLVVALALCHELFLVRAAMELYHGARLRSDEAVKHALVGTGWVVMMSGIVLAVSFSGLLFSQIAILNQVAFIMFWAMLWDGVVVRPVIVPVLMAPCGKANWWPFHARSDADAPLLPPHASYP